VGGKGWEEISMNTSKGTATKKEVNGGEKGEKMTLRICTTFLKWSSKF